MVTSQEDEFRIGVVRLYDGLYRQFTKDCLVKPITDYELTVYKEE